jgi:hypothetical protein
MPEANALCGGPIAIPPRGGFRGGDSAAATMAAALAGQNHDALAYYSKFVNFPAATDEERLEAVYALALGVGMQESSGRTGSGAAHDSANPNPNAATAEAGYIRPVMTL